ncbi:MAG: sulfatase-like hydrolase/transferase [Planctomycetaceae bacterium]|nr:sulfatase-like hydrolase/transferase [Planctomycetaceae bacterium]MCA9043613.1 sulfatase-like hydrolase/transferase [Planctomycetaceae bacterium]
MTSDILWHLTKGNLNNMLTRFSRAFVLFVVVALGLTVNAAETSHPNVLLIITDDQGYGDFGLHGNPHVKTPHIDALGKESIRFDRFYVNSFCAPTRAALLTGRYPLRTGTYGVTHNKETMRSDELTLGEVFSLNGYSTGCFGKWHNGEQFPYTPPGQGFGEFLGFHNGHTNNYFDPVLIRGAYPEQQKGYISDILTDAAIDFVSRQRDEPFFCYLSYNAPHSPYQVPDKYYDRLAAFGFDPAVAAFWGMCENIDDNIGRLLKVLDEQGETENTIVLFLTDNGGTAGVKIFNAGMRGGKTSVHEGGCRVPLFVRWPGRFSEPRLVTQIASHIDVLPTLIELCEVNRPFGLPFDGVSLVPLMDGKSGDWPERVLFTHNPISESNRYPGAVRTQQYRLVRELQGRQGGSSATPDDENSKPWQLYDMIKDPGEKDDLAQQHPDVVADLARQYEAWIDDISSTPLRRLPVQVGHAEEDPVVVNAPQSLPEGKLHFLSGPGFAHDWLTNWTQPGETVTFDLDVQHAGTYSVTALYSCPKENAGSDIRVTWGEQSHDWHVAAAPEEDVELPHRDERGRERYRNRIWKEASLGEFELTTGQHQLTLESVKVPAGSVMDFKAVRVQRTSEIPGKK